MEACALVWRQGLVSFLHLWYLRGKTPYALSTGEAGRAKRGGGDGGGAYISGCVTGLCVLVWIESTDATVVLRPLWRGLCRCNVCSQTATSCARTRM